MRAKFCEERANESRVVDEQPGVDRMGPGGDPTSGKAADSRIGNKELFGVLFIL